MEVQHILTVLRVKVLLNAKWCNLLYLFISVCIVLPDGYLGVNV